ncbi:MAG: autotransporter domain-containing protein [Chromatiales bacterium]|nr:autotransporter domain-containing protein [Chromatiales bacterium]
MIKQSHKPFAISQGVASFAVAALSIGATLHSNSIEAATGVPDIYTIDANDRSETIVVTVNDRLEISTLEAINAIEIVSVSSLSDAAAGSVQIDPDDNFSINVFPNAGFSGSVTFTYRVSDIRGTSDDTLVTLNIVSSTSILETVNDHYVSSGGAINLFPQENDIHPGIGFSVEILSQPSQGTLSTTDVTGLFLYTPPADISDPTSVSFDYRLVADSGEASAPASVTITLDPSLDPIANGGADEAQSSLAKVMQVACDANAAAGGSQTDEALATTCSTLSSMSGSELDRALEEVLLRQVGAQANSMKGVAANQIKNVAGRLQEIRSGVPGVSLAGLRAILNDQSLNLGRLLTGLQQGGGAGDGLVNERLGGFVTGTINIGDGESRDRENSFEIDNQELLAGLDYRFNNDLVMGTALGYSSSETSENGGDTGVDVDGWNLSIYGNYYPAKDWYVDWLLGYGESSIDTSRSIDIGGVVSRAKGDTDADIFSAVVGTGYSYNVQAWTIDGYTALEYRNSEIDAYRERNDAGLDMNISKTSSDVLSGRLGVRASNALSFSFGVLVPQFELELVKDFKNEAPEIEAEFALVPEAGSFTLTNEDPDDSYVNAGISLTGQFKNGITGFVRYSTMLARDDLDLDTWQLGARMPFGGPAEDIHLVQAGEDQHVAAGLFIGTTGPGLALTLPLRGESLNFRTLLATMPYDTEEELDDIEYDIDLDVFTWGALLDWHPMNGGFRVSGGLYALQPNITASAQPTEPVEIGNTTFTPAQVGTLEAEVDYSRNLAPYLGIGWGNAVKPGSKLSFSVDFGILFTDNPTISLEADSALADANPALKAQLESELAVEENRINSDDLDDIRYWPVINFGVAYHF